MRSAQLFDALRTHMTCHIKVLSTSFVPRTGASACVTTDRVQTHVNTWAVLLGVVCRCQGAHLVPVETVVVEEALDLWWQQQTK